MYVRLFLPLLFVSLLGVSLTGCDSSEPGTEVPPSEPEVTYRQDLIETRASSSDPWTVSGWTQIEYGASGAINLQSIRYDDGQAVFEQRDTLSYDNSGSFTGRVAWRTDTPGRGGFQISSEIEATEYNRDGLPLVVVQLSDDGAPSYRELYTYSSEFDSFRNPARILTERYDNGSWALWSRLTTLVGAEDDLPRATLFESYTPSGEWVVDSRDSVRATNGVGAITEMATYDGYNLLSSKEFTYSEDGKLIERIIESSGGRSTRIQSTYGNAPADPVIPVE